MKIIPTSIRDAFIIESEPISDDRGFFASLSNSNEFKKQNLETEYDRMAVSQNNKKGTLRGLHYQLPPKQEVKLIRCIKGKIYDVIVDIRKSSPSYKKYFAVELTPENLKSLYAPKGVAHAFLTLSDNTQVLYQISSDYQPDLYRGVRFNDPAFGIFWPIAPTIIHPRDASYPDFTDKDAV
ncbi:dTDP-4-dehydrorhamnose 3,5-epimerase [Candidatus Gottesmanbacteria bacterium RIFCSPHIGHO2_02_FULL_39_11]|uniref:dTDP-4-dehydrorhamnose 3,5-epimerase n=1 Tax=Candidatus Gottesmanbacteria bacterium RIFCSPHIGHO2_02_FULL_39_11 TaxID=1798382 RepID=A0A1F5ZJS0_9BACT|nr:MAG: dTDP-4-dehydrorhamnose 3,5-epimerase [Candidatus Gottesmanbacteria bacterium RIFCSPHIGHO2_02_FULL_39_11]